MPVGQSIPLLATDTPEERAWKTARLLVMTRDREAVAKLTEIFAMYCREDGVTPAESEEDVDG